jgi:hypothetical protein
MNIQVIGSTVDIRTGATVVYAQIAISDYIRFVGSDFDDFDLQRSRQKHAAYTKLKEDIKEGAVLPAITLALKPALVKDFPSSVSFTDVRDFLNKPRQVYILDGLQRTYIIYDLAKDDFNFNENQKLMLEIWIEADYDKLIYRFIVLNAGRKEVNLNHQIEILFLSLKDNMKERIGDIKILSKTQTRKKAKEYPFSWLVTSYYCFLTQQYEVDKKNLVAKKLLEESVIDGNLLQTDFEKFCNYLRIYGELDTLQSEQEEEKNWFYKETLMNAYFAAVGQYGNGTEQKHNHIKIALSILKQDITKVGIGTYNAILDTIDEQRYNVGMRARHVINHTFYEFFRAEGALPLEKLWLNYSNPIRISGKKLF